MSLVAALRRAGIVAPWVIDGPINGEIFLTWVEQVLVPDLRPDDIVGKDNLGTHTGLPPESRTVTEATL